MSSNLKKKSGRQTNKASQHPPAQRHLFLGAEDVKTGTNVVISLAEPKKNDSSVHTAFQKIKRLDAVAGTITTDEALAKTAVTLVHQRQMAKIGAQEVDEEEEWEDEGEEEQVTNVQAAAKKAGKSETRADATTAPAKGQPRSQLDDKNVPVPSSSGAEKKTNEQSFVTSSGQKFPRVPRKAAPANGERTANLMHN